MKHGGDLSEAMARHGGSPGEWLDLSTGINPFSWPLPADLPASAWTRLPSRRDLDLLLQAAREAYRVPDRAGIIAAPGTQALIQWLPVLAPPGPVAIVSPTYGEHALAWGRTGREVMDIDALGRLPAAARHAVVVNPNNPDGCVADHRSLRRAAAEMGRRGGWLVVDESFGDVEPALTAVALCPELPVVVLRSFGKFYGLAGIRLGFAVAAPPMAEVIGAALGPWAVAGPALAIGRAALKDQAWAEVMRARLAREAAALDAVLEWGGLTILGGTSLYRLAHDPRAAALHAVLAAQKIWVRRFDHLPHLLRFGLPPDPAGLGRLATVLASCLEAGS